MKSLLYILFIVPKNYLSYVVGWFVHLEQPEALATFIKKWFVKRYNINMEEAELPMAEYPSTGKLFTRKLKPNIRPIGSGIVHPCDGAISAKTYLDSQKLIQAKGKDYYLDHLLGWPPWSNVFFDGYAFTYYLCPTDYHRVHAPVGATIFETHYIPGKLWPVNDWSVNTIKNLFCVNERTVTYMETKKGPVAMVMVGATNVGKISLAYDDSILTNSFTDAVTRRYSSPITIKRGDEFGTFHMGSTVVVVYGKNYMTKALFDKISYGPTKLGEELVSI